MTFAQRLRPFPFVAILRGLRPDEAEAIGGVLVDRGFGLLEVPLNSPEPFDSISGLLDAYGDRAWIGAGTVRRTQEVETLADLGARLIVSPHCDPDVIARTVELGMHSIPGIFTPTEALRAIDAGAHALKWFPAQGVEPSYIAAMKAILPPHIPVLAVGGVDASNALEYWRAGVQGFGLGSALFRPGDTPQIVAAKADAIVAAWSHIEPS